MLINEAKWINKMIPGLPLVEGSTILNFGSQSIAYNNENKHILEYVINPLKSKFKLLNLDLQAGEGIDYSGDLCDDNFYSEFKKKSFDCILLCNVLEHVNNIPQLSTRIADLIKPGGILIFTGPYEFPVHFDPIDNLFRPKPEDVCSLFGQFSPLHSDIVVDYSYSEYLLKAPKQLFLAILRTIAFFYKFDKWRKVVLPKYLWWNKKFKITCVILKKNKI